MYSKLEKFCEDNKLKLAWHFEYNRYWTWEISITELLSILVDPTFEYIKQNHSEKLQQACDRWTAIHENIEKWIDTSNPHYRRFKEWKICEWVKILHKEKKFTREWIRGNIDAIIESDKLTWPVDYKSSLRRNEKYKLQLAWYCWLTWYTMWWILYLSDKKYIYDIFDIQEYLEIFEELLRYSKNIIAININEWKI
jgi:hypothetical protein